MSVRRKPYQPPKGIICHPGVEGCAYAPGLGFDGIGNQGFEFIHAVELKEGWRFSGPLLFDGIRQSARFRTVAEFRACQPVRIEPGRE